MALLGVPAPPEPAEARGPAPLAVVRSFRAYLSPLEVDHLVHLQAARDHTHALSDHRIHLYRQLAAGFIERVANRLGLQVSQNALRGPYTPPTRLKANTQSPHSPRRTIATAQKLYHRFHLHFSLVDFPHQDVSLACLLVASKLEDTLKKLRDIQIAAWQVQNLLDGGTGVGDGDPQVRPRPSLLFLTSKPDPQSLFLRLKRHTVRTLSASSASSYRPSASTSTSTARSPLLPRHHPQSPSRRPTMTTSSLRRRCKHPSRPP